MNHAGINSNKRSRHCYISLDMIYFNWRGLVVCYSCDGYGDTSDGITTASSAPFLVLTKLVVCDGLEGWNQFQ